MLCTILQRDPTLAPQMETTVRIRTRNEGSWIIVLNPIPLAVNNLLPAVSALLSGGKLAFEFLWLGEGDAGCIKTDAVAWRIAPCQAWERRGSLQGGDQLEGGGVAKSWRNKTLSPLI